MIHVRLDSNPLDPEQRLSHLLKLVLRDMHEHRKTSTTVQVEFSGEKKPLKFRLTFLGTSRSKHRP